jgi:hypothetical protein
MLGARYSQLPQEPEYLTDGGVYDNLGSQLASRLMAESNLGIELLFASDAGATFDWEIKRRVWWVYPRTVRATNILMKRVTDAAIKALGGIGMKAAQFPIFDVVPEQKFEGVLPADLQQRMADVRTDLDRFDTVADLLIRHGYEVALSRLLDRPDIGADLSRASAKTNPPQIWDGLRVRIASMRLQRAQRLSLMGLFNLSDWALFALFVKVTVIASLCYLPFYFQKEELRESNRKQELLRNENLQKEAQLRKAETPIRIEPGTTRIIRITNDLRIDAPVGQRASQSTFDGINIQFANQTSEPVVLYWIDFNGNATQMGQMGPGQLLAFSSFSGHLWVAKTAAGKELLRYAVK